MANGKSKYIVADQNTYNNVGAVIGNAQSKQEQTITNNNAYINQQFNNIVTEQPTNFSDVTNLYQQNMQPNYEQNYQSFDNLTNQAINTNVDFQFQQNNEPTSVEQYQSIPMNTNYQDLTTIDYSTNIQQTSFEQYQNTPMDTNYQDLNTTDYSTNIQPAAYPNNFNQPVANEFIENQAKHVSADQLITDYGLNNNIKVEDDTSNYNIDNQISNSRDIIYNGPTINNQNNQEITINHKNLDYNKANSDEVYSNSFSKKGQYIPPQRKLNTNNKPSKSERKRRRHNFFFNFLLFIIYALIFGVVGYFGYNYWLDQQQFFFSRDSLKIVQGNTFEETIYIKSKVQNNENYTFKSNDENIATVDKKGVITAISPGKTTIDVKSNEKKHTGKIEVEVISLEIKSFKVEQDEKKMHLDNTYTIVPIINGERDIVVDLQWKSSNENILTVSNSGIVTPHSVGIAEVTVSIPNTKHKAKVLIQVKK